MKKKYTLDELSQILNSKHYLPRDRFLHYFVTRFGYSEREAQHMFDVYVNFPKGIYDLGKHKILDLILPKALEIMEEIESTPVMPYSYDSSPEYKKLLYKEEDSNIVKEFVINFTESKDIITYSEILKRNIDIVAILSYCDSIYRSGKDSILVFEGDLFDTNDKFYSNTKSNVYIAEKDGTFRKLDYIKGKGYLKDNKPNIDTEHSYNFHALTLREYAKIGNAVTDLHILSDINIKKK